MNKKVIRLTESDLHKVIKESVNKILKEEHYSFNDYIKNKKYVDDVNLDEIYKENLKRFKNAYKLVSREYSIIDTLKRNRNTRYDAQYAFSPNTFIKYVKEIEGETLYEKIWESYGGEYEELADQYLQICVDKLKKGNYNPSWYLEN